MLTLLRGSVSISQGADFTLIWKRGTCQVGLPKLKKTGGGSWVNRERYHGSHPASTTGRCHITDGCQYAGGGGTFGHRLRLPLCKAHKCSLCHASSTLASRRISSRLANLSATGRRRTISSRSPGYSSGSLADPLADPAPTPACGPGVYQRSTPPPAHACHWPCLLADACGARSTPPVPHRVA